MIDIIIQGVTGFVLGLVIVVYFAGFLTPLAVIRMTLNFNNLTKFGILTYFNYIIVGSISYVCFFNEKTDVNSELWFQIICGVNYFIFIVSSLFEKKLPKIYIEEKAGK